MTFPPSTFWTSASTKPGAETAGRSSWVRSASIGEVDTDTPSAPDGKRMSRNHEQRSVHRTGWPTLAIEPYCLPVKPYCANITVCQQELPRWPC